ncbi:MAG: hypothetical protein ACT4OX_11860 [Actinomycetota bacterium]
MRASIVVVALAIAALLATGCASDGYTEVGTREKLEGAGLTGEEADCVVDRLERRIGADRLGGRDAPSVRQREVLTEVLATCEVTTPSTPTS